MIFDLSRHTTNHNRGRGPIAHVWQDAAPDGIADEAVVNMVNIVWSAEAVYDESREEQERKEVDGPHQGHQLQSV